VVAAEQVLDDLDQQVRGGAPLPGFRLPNGDCIAILVDGLLLPNGVRCPEDDDGGYVCP
jgi:hypothetical protein